MWSYIRTSLVLVSLFLFVYTSEAGLLRERLLSKSNIDDVYTGTSSDAHWPGRMIDRSLARYQNFADEKKGVPSDSHRERLLQRELSPQNGAAIQCRYGTCGK